MQWKKKHQAALKKIIEDIRLSPNRRLLGELLLLWIELEDTEDKQFIYRLIENQFGSPTRSVKIEEEEFNSSVKTKVEVEATETLKKYFSSVKENNAIPQEQLHITD